MVFDCPQAKGERVGIMDKGVAADDSEEV